MKDKDLDHYFILIHLSELNRPTFYTITCRFTMNMEKTHEGICLTLSV